MPRRHPFAPVVALDIDGTLGQYHQHFKRFAEPWLGHDLELNWNPEFKGEFSRALGLDKEVYRKIKLHYRQGGLKRSMPVYPHASALTRMIQEAGAQVWICTTRPYLRLDNIDPDTREFLDRNDIRYDAVLYGEEKYEDLVMSVGQQRVVAVLEDLPEMIQSANALHIPSIMQVRDHNKWWLESETGPHCTQLMNNSTLFDVGNDIVDMVLKWREEYGDGLIPTEAGR